MIKLLTKRPCRAASAALLLSTTLLTLPSCSTLARQGLVSQKASKFDGATKISMSPAVVVGTEFKMGYPLLGADWSSKTPNTVYLVLENTGNVRSGNSYSNIYSLDINVDGQIYRNRCTQTTAHSSGGYNKVAKTIYTKSRNVVDIPLSLAKRMVAANTCMLQVRTSDGVFEQNFAKEKNAYLNTAKVHMRKFLAKVEAAKK